MATGDDITAPRAAAAAAVRYAILGPVEIRDAAGPIPAGGPRQLALLAFLLLNANATVSSDRLIEALWGDDARGADKRLQMAVARLRKVLDAGEPVLHTSAGGYALQVAPGELDAHVFEAAIADGRAALAAGDAERASSVLARALELWRGAPLVDVGYMEFAQPEIRRLEELRLGALEARVDADLALGAHAAVVGSLESLLAEHPTRERIAAQLMIALYRCGRQAEALDAYLRTRAHLSEELGLEPGPALQALQAEILEQSPALDAPPPAGPARKPAPIPALVARLGAKRLIGREAVLERVTQIWDEVVTTRTHRIVLLAGEPGVGKTSLATRLACDAGAQGATVLYGRADPEALIPYQPFVEALRHLVLHADLTTLESSSADLVELSRLVPELCRRLPDLASPAGMTGGDERYKLFSAVAALLVDAAATAPVLIVLDDLHWADASSLRLLSHLARYSDPAPLLILGTYRDTDLPHAPQLADTLVDLNREHLDERILVAGLDERAVGELIADATQSAPHDLAPLLLLKTRGNPFFLVEMLRHLADSDAFDPLVPAQPVAEAARHDAARLLGRIGVPDGVRQLVERRLTRLDGRTREALMLASVLGQTFDLGSLAAVTERAPVELSDALDEALQAGLLSEVAGPPGTFEFSHALVRETLYRRPSSVRRELLHRRAGEALVAHYHGRDDAHAAELARHFLAAGARGDAERAVHYSVIAAHQALTRLAYEEAAELFSLALERAGASGGPLERDEAKQRRRYELLTALGEARWCAGDLDDARGAYLRAAELAADTLGDPERLGQAALGYAGPLRFEPTAARADQPLVELLTRAIDALADAPGPMRARLQARLAAVLLSGGDGARKRELARDAIALARAAGDRAALAEVLSTCLFATRSPDNLRWRIETGRELEQLADELGDAGLQAVTHGALLDDTLEAGDIDASNHEREAFERLADELGERYRRWLVMLAKSRAALVEGRIDESEALALQASTLGLGGDDESAFHALGGQLLVVRREQSRLDELLPGAEAFAAQYPEIPAWRCGLAFVYAELGRKDDASRELDALGANRFAALPRDAWWLLGTAMLGEVAAFVEHPVHVPVLYEQLVPYADHCVVITTICNGSAARVLGLLATALGRFDDAERHFQDALDRNARIRSPLWVGHTRRDYAAMLLRRDGPGDAELARTLLEAALRTASELGLHAVARRAEPLIRPA